MELKEGIKQINQSVTQSSASDATLEGYMLELKDANGNLVDKQPVSKIESLVYNYLTTKRQSELANAVGGDQNGYADGFVKFINTFIDDTIDNPRPNGIYPLVGETASDRGFVFRFFSNKHARAIEIRYIEQKSPSFRIYVGGQWSEWIQTPSYLNNYPDIASLASGMNTQNDIKHGEFTGSQFTVRYAKGLLVVKNNGTSTILVAAVYNGVVTILNESPYIQAEMNGYDLTISIEEGLETYKTTYTII